MWRGVTGRRARLAAALQAVEVVPLDAELGRNAGVLIAGSGHADAIDAALVALADHGDQIISLRPQRPVHSRRRQQSTHRRSPRLNPTHIPADDFPPTRLVALVAGAGVVTVDPLLHHRLVA